MARRSANDGTVVQTANGRWAAVIELPRSGDGKRQRRWRRARTKAEAQELLREMRDELHRTGTISNATRTVAEAVEDWRAERPDNSHDDWVLGLIVEGLGAARVAALTVPECDRFLKAAAGGLGDRQPVGQAHLRRVRQRLIGVLKNEIRLGYATRNVAEVSQLPRIDAEPKPRRALTADELGRLLAVAKGARLILVDLCGRNALRPAEARALRWADIDLDAQELSVTGQQTRGNERGKVKRAHNAARTIMLDERTIERLTAWRIQQEQHRAAVGESWIDLDLVASTAQGTAIDRHAFARSMRLLCEHAGIEPTITPYELRHTAMSLQADAGRSSWEIADWAGTSEAMVSSRYRHRLRRVAGLRPVDG